MCYIVWHSVSLFSPAASFKARESKAMQEILLREFWFSPLPDLILLSKRTQKNLMKWEYLGITGSKLTLYYRWSLEERREWVKDGEHMTPHVHVWNASFTEICEERRWWGVEKAANGWKGLESLLPRRQSMPSLLRVSLIPLGRAHHSQQDPVYLPGDLSPINLQTQPLTRTSACLHSWGVPTETWQPNIQPIVRCLPIFNTSLKRLSWDLI